MFINYLYMKKKYLFILVLFTLSCTKEDASIDLPSNLLAEKTEIELNIPENIPLITAESIMFNAPMRIMIPEDALLSKAQLIEYKVFGYTRVVNLMPMGWIMFDKEIANQLGIKPNWPYHARIDKYEYILNLGMDSPVAILDSPNCGGSILWGSNGEYVDWMNIGYSMEVTSDKKVLNTGLIYIDFDRYGQSYKQYFPRNPNNIEWRYAVFK